MIRRSLNNSVKRRPSDSQRAILKRIVASWRRLRTVLRNPRKAIDQAIIDYLHGLEFLHFRRPMVHGSAERLHLGNNKNANNSIFNTRSGHIYIGDDTVFGYCCQFVTGVHLFEDGRLKQPKSLQVPEEGYDIRIGSGCWIASGAIITGGVTIGENCVVAAGAVVTRSFPSGCIIGGVPARIIGYTDTGQQEQQSDRALDVVE